MTRRRTTSVAVACGLLAICPATQLRAQEPPIRSAVLLQDLVARIPIGSTVDLRLQSGDRLRAVLMLVDGADIIVKPATRVPERSRRMPITALQTIERYEDAVSVGKYCGVGGGIGAAALLMLLAGI